MTHETDLPCSDCGAGLFERTIDVQDLPFATTGNETVTIAECPRCGARFYPEDTLSRLRRSSTDRSRGGS
jgi:uncharacterized protein with PIN domain